VQAHEGKVWARSEVGKGTSFVLRLRRVEQVEGKENRDAGEPATASDLSDALRVSTGGETRG